MPAPRGRATLLRQQEAITELGQRALAGGDVHALMQQAAESVAAVLEVDLVEVLELLPGRRDFATRGRVGWAASTLVPVAGTHVGLSLDLREPVLVEDTATERRFPTTKLRRQHAVVSGLAVPMVGREEELGAVAVHSRHARAFSADDVHFVQAMANVVASAMERRAAEEALERTSTQLRSVIDASPAVIYLKDLDGAVTLANRRFEDLFGAQPAAAIDPHDEAVIAAALPMEFEERLVLDGGEERIFISLKFPLRDAAGRVTGVGGVSTDVTERTRAAEERAELEARLARAERLETVGQLAGGIAHDFNNLLAVIANYAGFLRDAVEPESRAADDVEQILAASRAANELTRRLLLFSRRRAGNPEVLDLSTAIADTEQLLQRALGEQIELRTRVEPELRTVRADRSQIEQVLMNLALNARDAMPDGGVLTIEAANVDGEVQVVVSDTGTGMPDEILDRAFEPFFSTKGAAEGSGLGLATVYGIVRGAGGRVELRSAEREGTSVVVRLPGSDEAAPEPAPVPAAAAPGGGGECVLLVEDKEAVRVLTTRILEEAGYRVLVAPEGHQALGLYSAEIDVLVTDVVMPGVSGRELADQLRERRPGLPVVFVSGYTEDHVVEEARRDGTTAFVEKPFSSADLLSAVRAVLADP